MVKGVLKFENPGAIPGGQSVRISVQDTARAGSSALDIAEVTITVPEDFDAESDDLPFEIDFDDPRAGLTVRAHLARHEGSDIRKGDMITMASIPVSADSEEEIAVTLRRV
jgi:hypothetical protein